jgi:hypothetical protein
MNTYEITIYPKGSSNVIKETIEAGTSNDAKKVMESRYPGASITNVVKK